MKRIARKIDAKKNVVFTALLASVCAAASLYEIFYLFSGRIWSMNSKIPSVDLAPHIRPWLVEHDGIETYVLYILVFFSILFALFLAWLYEYLRLRHRHAAAPILLIVFFGSGYLLFSSIGFHLPMAERSSGISSFILMAIVVMIPWALIGLDSRKSTFAGFVVASMLLPVCFIATSAISSFDYSFVFAPSLRMLHHFPLSDIYFQYDLFLSLLAALWMKLNIDLNSFQILGQVSYYVLFLSAFLLAKKFFIEKRLAYYLLVTLVLVKTYALICDPVLVFQVTPLRLDWWILVWAFAFIFGIYSKRLGIALGLLLIFHKTFGFIYLIGYLEVIFLLFALDFFGSKPSLRSLAVNTKKHLLLCLPNIGIVAIALGVSYFLLGGFTTEAASAYRTIGIGFIQISNASFYWHFVVLLGAVVIILMRRREFLSLRYLNGSLFLILLSIGSSMYFFGRSHENNIINIAAPLIFVLFLFIDLVSVSLAARGEESSRLKKALLLVIPSGIVMLITFSYSARILDKVHVQSDNLSRYRAIYPAPLENTWNISTIRELTSNSDKVYFMGADDFYYYYYGKYVPISRFFPYTAWVHKKDMVSFMQGILNDGYYIVSPRSGQGPYPDPQSDDEILSELTFDREIVKDGFRVVWNETDG